MPTCQSIGSGAMWGQGLARWSPARQAIPPQPGLDHARTIPRNNSAHDCTEPATNEAGSCVQAPLAHLTPASPGVVGPVPGHHVVRHIDGHFRKDSV